jgi:hypothetical protein
LIPSEELNKREKTSGRKSMINFACCTKTSLMNLAYTFKCKPIIQLYRGGTRGLPKVCSYGIAKHYKAIEGYE